MDHEGYSEGHCPEPGCACPTCGRVVPKAKSDDKAGPKRTRIAISVPPEEAGVLDELMVQVCERYQEAWPREFANMRAGLGLEVVGGKRWQYHVLHFALTATLMVPGLEPVEEG